MAVMFLKITKSRIAEPDFAAAADLLARLHAVHSFTMADCQSLALHLTSATLHSLMPTEAVEMFFLGDSHTTAPFSVDFPAKAHMTQWARSFAQLMSCSHKISGDGEVALCKHLMQLPA